MQIVLTIIFIILGYLAGSLNFAVIVCRLTHREDVRHFGSKNAGMTNMLRVYGKGAAAATLAGDLFKGAVIILICRLVFFLLTINEPAWTEYVVAIAALLGHTFPVFYGFKGGKGVLVSIGMLFVLTPLPAAATLLVFLLVVAISKIVSLSSILGAVSLPFWVWLFDTILSHNNMIIHIIATALMAAFVIYMHRSNIVRLIHGEEHSFKKKSENK